MVRGSLPASLLTTLLATAPVHARPQGPSTEAVNAAIDRGLDFLLRNQNRDGSWGVDINERGSHWHDLRDGSCGLALYTLLKCGLGPEHPAIQRALAFLLENTPRHTYATGVQLHALGALRDPGHKKRMEALLETLLDLRESGGWDYPGYNRVDLSNTQVAALGLRAAHAAGLTLPKEIWRELVGIALRFQENPVEIPGTALQPKEKRRMAGFFYEPGREPTASMTTAGLTILGIVTEDPSRVDQRLEAEIAEARQLALNWLEQNYSVEGNPKGDVSWHFYYLYGLERVGAFNGLERIGGHDWYQEGAAMLLKEQRVEGGWRTDDDAPWPWPLVTPNTCFALLFLRKATLSAESHGRRTLYLAEGDSDVWVRVDAKQSWTMWVSGFAPEVLARYPAAEKSGDARSSLCVERVEWWIDGRAAGTVAGEPARPWRDERYPLRYEPDRSGELEVECRVTAHGADGVARELRSKLLMIASELVLEPWMLAYARDASQNVFNGQDLLLTASSEESIYHPKGDVLDGLQGSAWWAKEDDPEPWIRLESAKGVRLKELWLSPAGASEVLRAQCVRFATLELRLNDAKAPLVITMEADERLKTKFVLQKPQLVRRLELRVIAAPYEKGKFVGLAEIEAR